MHEPAIPYVESVSGPATYLPLIRTPCHTGVAPPLRDLLDGLYDLYPGNRYGLS